MSQNAAMPKGVIPTRVFGKTGIEVTVTGLGGEGVLRSYGQEGEAWKVIREAVDHGISYFDCARAYAGSETYYGQVWSRHPEDRARIFQAGKSGSRSKNGALADLDQTLRNMDIDYLDLWQIHDVRTEEDLEIISSPGGAVEAFLEAKTKGKTRFIGVTGHQIRKSWRKPCGNGRRFRYDACQSRRTGRLADSSIGVSRCTGKRHSRDRNEGAWLRPLYIARCRHHTGNADAIRVITAYHCRHRRLLQRPSRSSACRNRPKLQPTQPGGTASYCGNILSLCQETGLLPGSPLKSIPLLNCTRIFSLLP